MKNTTGKEFSIKPLLRPFVRFCVRRSIKLQDVVDELKALFVELAEEELRDAGAEVSANKLSLMTGVHRKDISSRQKNSEMPKRTADAITRIIGQWLTDKKYTTGRGAPRVLSFSEEDSPFSELVASVSRELNPHSVLFELERSGAVSKTSRGLKLEAEAYIPREGSEEGVRFLGEDAEDLYACVEENLFAKPSPSNLHLKTEFDNVPVKKRAEIQSWINEEGFSFHKKIRNYLAKFDQDVSPGGGVNKKTMRVAVGAFSRIDLKNNKNVGA